MLEYLSKLNQLPKQRLWRSRVDARIAQYEMAYRMQTSVPEVMDVSDELADIFEMYGPDSRDLRHLCASCTLARKLLERT